MVLCVMLPSPIVCVHAIHSHKRGNTLTLPHSLAISLSRLLFFFHFFLLLLPHLPPSSSSLFFFVFMQIRSVFGEGDRVCESKAKGRARAMGLLHLDDG